VRHGSITLLNKIIPELDFNVIPDEKTIVIESVRSDRNVVIHACFGTKINSTLATILSSLLESTLGYVVQSRSDAYRIVLESKARFYKKIFGDALTEEFVLRDVVTASLVGTHNVNWRTWCVAKKFGMVGRGAIYDRKSGRCIYERHRNTPIVMEALRELFHDKFDLKSTETVLNRIRSNEIQFEWVDVD